MPVTKSVLRYPGGKTQMTEFVEHVIQKQHLSNPIYCEPFSGGSGVSIALLLSNVVDTIILNDYDPAIYSLWYAVLHEPQRLSDSILSIPITIDEWHRQKEIYTALNEIREYNFDLALSTLFLNRTNRAGIITGGPIGGYEQRSKYSLNCRFNRATLVKKITQISSQRHRVQLYMKDAAALIHELLLKQNPHQLFTFFDPPYYKQGQTLYKNAFTHKKHVELYQSIRTMDDYSWIATYDICPEIRDIYQELPSYTYSLQYSATITRKEKEYLFCSPSLSLRSYSKFKLHRVRTSLKSPIALTATL